MFSGFTLHWLTTITRKQICVGCVSSCTTCIAKFKYLNLKRIMGQLTLARFRGDTTFGLVARIVSTFVGGIIGTVIWFVPLKKFTRTT